MKTPTIRYEICVRLMALVLLGIIVAALCGCGGVAQTAVWSPSPVPAEFLPEPSDDHYFYDILVNDETPARWTNMPIGIYFDPETPENWQDKFIGFLEGAMQDWEDATDGVVQFERLFTPEDPCIRVKWVKDDPLNQGKKAAGAAKLVTITVNGSVYFDTVHVEIATTSTSGTPFSDNVIRYASVHELGHAIGLWGHSDDSKDVMYSKGASNFSITSRDKTTTLLLYAIPAEYVIREKPRDVRGRPIDGRSEIIITCSDCCP